MGTHSDRPETQPAGSCINHWPETHSHSRWEHTWSFGVLSMMTPFSRPCCVFVTSWYVATETEILLVLSASKMKESSHDDFLFEMILVRRLQSWGLWRLSSLLSESFGKFKIIWTSGLQSWGNVQTDLPANNMVSCDGCRPETRWEGPLFEAPRINTFINTWCTQCTICRSFVERWNVSGHPRDFAARDLRYLWSHL